MPSIVPGFEYDIFISYRHNDNRSGWVTEFVKALQEELAATIKESVSVYFDSNPHDGLLETHNVDKSLEGKLKCLIFIPILSQTYCDPKSFAWQHEFCAFNRIANGEGAGESPRQLAGLGGVGRDIKLSNGNVASRILPIKIHDLDAEDKSIIEKEIGGALRAIEFIYKEPGVNRPLKSTDNKNENQNKTDYRNQVNKVSNAIKEIIAAIKNPSTQRLTANQLPNANQASSKKKIVISIAALLLITISFFTYRQLFAPTKQAPIDKSIAVLPFVNMSDDASQEYFSDGLTEEIIDRLTKIPDLRVISRTSVMEYKKSDKRTPEIGRELGVSYILEGSVRRSENNLRITVQLIQAGNDEHIWSETLDKPLSEIFQMQRDIATQLASYFKITLSESERGSLNQIPTKFISAYDYYLKANEMSGERSIENNQAMDLLKKAIAIDPQFTDAIAGLSYCYAKKGTSLGEGENWLDTAHYYATKAVAISPESISANARLGFVLMQQEKDLLALPYLKKATRSGSSMGLKPLSTIYWQKGMVDSAYYYAKLLVSKDPLGGGISALIHFFTELDEKDSASHYVNLGLASRLSGTVLDITQDEVVEFFVHAGKYGEGLNFINETMARSKDPAIIKEASYYTKTIYALSQNWEKLEGILTEDDWEWKALIYKNKGDKIKFDKAIQQLRIKDPYGNLPLLTGDFKKTISQWEAITPSSRYTRYQWWFRRSPFAKELIKTPEFKKLFQGYDAWRMEMLTSIKVMNDRKR